jgi:IS30 family transposase
MTAPYQSKLIPHEDFIRQCRAKRWSYPQIAAALLAEHGLKTGASTIFDFVKVRARKKRLIELPPSSRQTTQPSVNPTPADGFFEPAPGTPTHEIRKPKYKINI